MEENTTVQNETEELEAGTLAAFDEGWDEDETPVATADGQDDTEDESEEPDNGSESEETEADADQRKADGNEGGETGESSESEGKGEEGQPDQAVVFPDVKIKYLGNEEVISGDRVVEYVQKGRDYDRVKGKWDGVKDDVPRLRMYENFLGELASARGGTGDIKDEIDALIDETRIRTIMAKAEAEGREISPAAAAQQAVKIRTGFVPEGMAVDPEEERQEKSQREVERFLHNYKDVPAETIPKEVWDDVKDPNGANGDLLGAYRGYENRKLKEELKGLKKELEEVKQQAKNQKRSTGSTKSIGAAAKKDAFDEGWDFDS